MAGFFVILVLNENKISSHTTHISQHINYQNYKIISHDHTIKIIVDVGNNKCDNNYNSSPQLSTLNNSLLMRIVDTSENDLSHVEGKAVKRKSRTSLVK